MSLMDQVSAELKKAMLAKDAPRTTGLRMIRAAFIELEKEGKGEVTELHVETLYLDAEERVLKQQLHYAVSSLRPPARPGDTVPVRIISEVPYFGTISKSVLKNVILQMTMSNTDAIIPRLPIRADLFLLREMHDSPNADT